ncbi:hypothetical protein MRX96_055488 [Rhipicephalus microplus]
MKVAPGLPSFITSWCDVSTDVVPSDSLNEVVGWRGRSDVCFGEYGHWAVGVRTPAIKAVRWPGEMGRVGSWKTQADSTNVPEAQQGTS